MAFMSTYITYTLQVASISIPFGTVNLVGGANPLATLDKVSYAEIVGSGQNWAVALNFTPLSVAGVGQIGGARLRLWTGAIVSASTSTNTLAIRYPSDTTALSDNSSIGTPFYNYVPTYLANNALDSYRLHWLEPDYVMTDMQSALVNGAVFTVQQRDDGPSSYDEPPITAGETIRLYHAELDVDVIA